MTMTWEPEDPEYVNWPEFISTTVFRDVDVIYKLYDSFKRQSEWRREMMLPAVKGLDITMKRDLIPMTNDEIVHSNSSFQELRVSDWYMVIIRYSA